MLWGARFAKSIALNKLRPFPTLCSVCPRNRVNKELCLLLIWFSWFVIFLLLIEPWVQEVLYCFLYYKKKRSTGLKVKTIRTASASGRQQSRDHGELSEGDSCSRAPTGGGYAGIWVSAPGLQGLPVFQEKLEIQTCIWNFLERLISPPAPPPPKKPNNNNSKHCGPPICNLFDLRTYLKMS